MPLDYKYPKQNEACVLHGSKKYTMLYGGSRSGKTFITLRNIFLRASTHKSRHLVARRTGVSLNEGIIRDIPKVIETCFPSLRVKENKSAMTYTLDNGSVVKLSGLDDKERVDKILGAEYSTIYINEATEVPWQTVQVLLSRLAENAGFSENKMWFDCNPKFKSHWTYTVPITGHLEKVRPYYGKKINNHDRWGVLQMNPGDNLGLSQDYINDALGNMTDDEKKRFFYGVFQDHIEGALWTTKMVQDAINKEPDTIEHTVIAVDPAVSHTEDSDETGIVVCSRDRNKHGVVQADLSIKASTQTWGQRAVNAYHQYKANAIVAEKNNGGDLVKDLIKSIDKNIPVHLVHAAKGKFARAEPVAALYEQGKIAHAESFHDLETEMTEYVPLNAKYSPNRLDALVWGLDYLFLGLRGSKKSNIAASGPRMITA